MFYKLSAQEKKKNYNFYDWPFKQRVNRRFRMKLPVHAKDMAIFFLLLMKDCFLIRGVYYLKCDVLQYYFFHE